MECLQMKPGYRRGFSTAGKTELWDRGQRGESLKAIGRVFGKPSSSVYFQLAPHGGIRPAPRRRSRLALSLSEREEISRGIVAERSIRAMARLLGRSPSTVSREIRRNGGYDRYRAAQADKRAWDGACRPKRCKLARHPALCLARCHPRQSIEAYLFKPAVCLRKSFFSIFGPSAQSAAPNRQPRKAAPMGKSRT